ncbi:ankyrin [Acrasis kona]|uniref:Ankyrin n=1 Tax=Acrasis kona TaxID=1008807 RepID=A0AAW2ZBA5_9EUKA
MDGYLRFMLSGKAHTDVKKVREYIDGGCNINLKFMMGEKLSGTILHWSVRHGFQELVEVLLRKGSNVEETTSGVSITPLAMAVTLKLYEIVRLLLYHNADVNAEFENGITAMHGAAANGDLSMVRLLLEHGFIASKHPLLMHRAVSSGSFDIVKLFSEAKCPVDELDYNGFAPIHVAAQVAHYKILFFLIDVAKANPLLITSPNCSTILHLCCTKTTILSVLQKILSYGLDTEVADKDGSTPLIISVIHKSLNNVRLLVKLGADLSASDFNGDTAFHIAARNKTNDIGRFLFESEADVYQTNNDGISPYDLVDDIIREKIITERVQGDIENYVLEMEKIISAQRYRIAKLENTVSTQGERIVKIEEKNLELEKCLSEVYKFIQKK